MVVSSLGAQWLRVLVVPRGYTPLVQELEFAVQGPSLLGQGMFVAGRLSLVSRTTSADCEHNPEFAAADSSG